MRQGIKAVNEVDMNGYPGGGFVDGVGIDINWQNGPLGRGDDRIAPNGAFVEDVLDAVRQRIDHYQSAADGKFRCRENEIALTHIETAMLWLDKRTRDREARGVEGTHKA